MQGGWTTVWDNDQKVPYTYKGNEWIGYDNIESVKEKTEYAISRKLGGVMIYSLEQDDVRGICGNGAYPLMSAIRSILNNDGGINPTTTTTTKIPSTTSSTKSSTSSAISTTTKSSPTSTTTLLPPSGTVCQNVGYARDPNNCNIFYRCEKNLQ